jgi:NAD(P)H-dependent flavin oxidoreductase YrpB (nitropropane dioxygenase family)
MRTALTELLGVRYPIVGFNRSPGVVAEVTKAGGFGVLAASAYTPEELDAQLTWIEKRVDGKPYGVDLLVPEKFAPGDPDNLISSLRAQIPRAHLDFVNGLLTKYDIRKRPRGTYRTTRSPRASIPRGPRRCSTSRSATGSR